MIALATPKLRQLRLTALSLALVFPGFCGISYASPKEFLASAAEMKQRITHDVVDWQELREKAKLNGHKIHIVNTASAFQERSDHAKPGDIIQIKNGTYENWNVRINSKGTDKKPITYMAETPGQVTFKYEARIRVTGAYNIIGGFVFKDVETNRIIDLIGASHNRLTDTKFDSCGTHPKAQIIGLADKSNNNRVDHNIMNNNQAFGMVITLNEHSKVSQYNRFDHNTFQDIYSEDFLEKIALQLGQNGVQGEPMETFTLIDNNQFINVDTMNVNSKSHYEYYIDNFFINVPRVVAISLRAGSHKLVEGNYFANVQSAVRAFGANHTISNNIVINATGTALAIPSWGWVETPTDYLAYYQPTRDIIISNNLIHSHSKAIELGSIWGFTANKGLRTADNPPERAVVVNNILVGKSANLLDILSSIDPQIKDNNLVQ